MLLRVSHTDWQIAEKHLRRIRELLNEQAHDGEDDASDTLHEFKSFSKHKIYDLKRGKVASIYTAPGPPRPRQMIDEDDQEYQVMLEWAYKVATGRQFRKDEVTGEWVLEI